MDSLAGTSKVCYDTQLLWSDHLGIFFITKAILTSYIRNPLRKIWSWPLEDDPNFFSSYLKHFEQFFSATFFDKIFFVPNYTCMEWMKDFLEKKSTGRNSKSLEISNCQLVNIKQMQYVRRLYKSKQPIRGNWWGTVILFSFPP